MMKFGLMKYSYTTNLGNEIQSIASRQFLPTIDCYIDHEKLNLFECSQKVKLIMNGWYLDCPKSWPPSQDIDPLLISMHFSSTRNDTIEVITTKESRDYFSSHDPIGCRDLSTLNLLNELDIDAYYSGDLTLTLKSENKTNDNKYIVVNSHISSEIVEFLKTKTDIPIYEIYQESIKSFDLDYLENKNHRLTSFYDYEEKFFLAESILRLYENAYCVITDRVHCVMPCLAFKTPVLFFDDAKFAPERLEGLEKLVLKSNFDEYKENYSIFDVENPPKNPNDYMKLRKDLIHKTKKFTGHYADCYDSGYSKDYIINKQMELLTKTALETRQYMGSVIKISKKKNSQLKKKNSELSKLKKMNKEKPKEKSKSNLRNLFHI